jgi:hypothetical protein
MKQRQLLAVAAEMVMTAVSHPDEAAGDHVASTMPENPHGCWKLSRHSRINARARARSW